MASEIVSPKKWTDEEIDAYIAAQVAAAPSPTPEMIAEINKILGPIPRAGSGLGAVAETVVAA